MPLAFPLELVKGEAAQVIRNTIRRLAENEAVKLINAPSIVWRIANPKDFGLNNNEWSVDVNATDEATIIRKDLDDKTMIVLFGVYNLDDNPIITRLQIGTNAGPLEDVDVQWMYQFDYPSMLFDRPIVFSPKSTVKIDAYATSTGTQKLGFIAVVFEPEGKTIRNP